MSPMKATSAVAKVLDRRELLGSGLELALHLLDPGLDLADLPAGLGKDRPQSLGQVRVSILDEGPHERHDLSCAHRDEHAQFAQEAAQRVEPGRPLRHPSRTQTME